MSVLSRADSIPSTTWLNLGRTSTIGRTPISPSRHGTIRSIPPQAPRRTLSNGYVKYNSRPRQSLGMRPFSSTSLQRRDSTGMTDAPIHSPETALTSANADPKSDPKARIELAFHNTRFGPSRTPELILSLGSSHRGREIAIPRPNPTTRNEILGRSMYVDENGETYVNVPPDEFPFPPPIFPLSPPRSAGVVLPKLTILTGTDALSRTRRRANVVTPQSASRWKRNSSNSNQTDQPASPIPSLVYGSDIVAGSGSRNLLHNLSFRRRTFRSSTIDDDYADEYLDTPGRSALSSQYTGPRPISRRLSSPRRTFTVDEDENGLSVVEEEGSFGGVVMSAVGGKRYSFAMRDKGKSKIGGKRASKASSARSRRSRRASSMVWSGAPLRTAGTNATGEGGQWGNVPPMVVGQILTSPISAPPFPIGAPSPGILPAVRGRTRTRVTPRGPRIPEQGNTVSHEERLPRAYMVSPKGGSFAKQV
jgi:hypothetical protein